MQILGMSSFIPEQICDVIKFDGYQGDQTISNYCGYVADYISQVHNDETIDGAVYPKTCDSSRVITSYLENTNKFLHQLHVPARQDASAIEVFTQSIKQYKEAVEQYYGVSIADEEIRERSNMVNERNARLEDIYKKVGDIRYSDYLKLIHDLQKSPLKEHEEMIERCSFNAFDEGNKPVYIVGSRLTNMPMIECIEQSGMRIVGDNITESKRLFSQRGTVDMNGLYLGISTSILKNKLSPTQNSFGDMLLDDMGEICQKGAKGVIFLTQKYCEAYDYLFSIYKKALEDKGIPVLRISLSGTSTVENNRLSIEAFAEML